MSTLSTFIVNPELSVVCFRRDNCKNGPFFAVREFDIKVIRSRDKGRRGRGPSEQAIRASIRQAVLNMNLKSERASKAEIRQLKGHGILGKRAPSCSLLCAEDMCRLLEAFGKEDCVRDLRLALSKDRKTEDTESKTQHLTNGDEKGIKKRKSMLSDSRQELKSRIISKRPKITIDSLPSSNVVEQNHHREPLTFHSNGLDALYSALLAFSDQSVDPSIWALQPSIPLFSSPSPLQLKIQ